MNFPSLSVCLILKNEDINPARTLESIKDIADEIVVVTLTPSPSLSERGGKDSHPGPLPFDSAQGALSGVESKEGAEVNTSSSSPLSFSDEKKRGFRGELKVYEYPWNNNFSEVKNFAIEQATSDWILFLESDEALVDTNITEYLNRQDIDSYYLKYIESSFTVEEINKLKEEAVWSISGPEKNSYETPKFAIYTGKESSEESNCSFIKAVLFRRDKGIKFSGRVFETLADIDSLTTEISDIKIIQQYYSKENKLEKLKTEKYLLQLALFKDQLSSEELTWHKAKLISNEIEMAKTAAFKPEINKEQLLQLNNQIENIKQKEKFQFWYYEIPEILINEHNDLNFGFAILKQGISFFPDSVKLIFLMAVSLYKTGNIEESGKALNKLYQLLLNTPEILNPEISIDTKLLNPDHINYLRAVTNYELADYSAFEHYTGQISRKDKYQSVINKLNKKRNSEINGEVSADVEGFGPEIIIKPKIYERFNFVNMYINPGHYVVTPMYDDNI
jgi:glycosyltransferase involved in cell wall biosynthesis